jgi:hypothetical protein
MKLFYKSELHKILLFSTRDSGGPIVQTGANGVSDEI